MSEDDILHSAPPESSRPIWLGIGGRATLMAAVLFAVYAFSYAPLVRLAFGSTRIASYPVGGVWKVYTPLLQLMQIAPFRSLMFGWGMVWDVGQNIDSTSAGLLGRSGPQGDFTHGLLTGLLLGIGIPALAVLLELRARTRSR